jgi:MFS-type transporter involved in bile tolerance (Atg22 family)
MTLIHRWWGSQDPKSKTNLAIFGAISIVVIMAFSFFAGGLPKENAITCVLIISLIWTPIATAIAIAALCGIKFRTSK